MPLLGTRGAASAQGFGEFAQQTAANYIEDVFSTYLYKGNASTQNIVNGIDLAGKGGMVWGKTRNDTTRHVLFDTARGVLNEISSNLTAAQTNHAASLTAFNSNGYTLGNDDWTNYSTTFNSVSWTFRKQPKFFDVVTYTGDGTTNRAIAHSLGSAPGCIIVKNLSGGTNWAVYHRSLGFDYFLELDATGAATNVFQIWGNQNPNSTNFYVSQQTGGRTNQSGATYVAYLFAHDAGGFGATGTDNVISCGSFTTNGSGIASVNLGYEPQWVLFKASSTSSNWYILDNMRGLDAVKDQGNALAPNLSNAEFTFDPLLINATGFNVDTAPNPNTTYIYIAIRRGPMRTPTSGTSVFNAVSRTGTGATATITGPSFPPDFVQVASRSAANGFLFASRLQGNGQQMLPSNANAEGTNTSAITTINQNGITVGTGSFVNTSGQTYINYFLGRAPGFMDVVCYTGTGANQQVTHNLTVAPELLIVKRRSSTANWAVRIPSSTDVYYLNTTASPGAASWWDAGANTSTYFTTKTASNTYVNDVGSTYVAYLFASCPGVSKVGSYSGTGATQTISCGFAARFVMIKRTDSTGDWYVYDTTRGMVAGTDPYLLYNTTGAEVNQNDVYTNASGFQLVSGNAGTNASGGTYIYLAIA